MMETQSHNLFENHYDDTILGKEKIKYPEEIMTDIVAFIENFGALVN